MRPQAVIRRIKNVRGIHTADNAALIRPTALVAVEVFQHFQLRQPLAVGEKALKGPPIQCASKNERIPVWGTVIGGIAYFLFAAVSFLAYSATLIDPAMVSKYFTVDSQQILPALVKGHLPLSTPCAALHAYFLPVRYNPEVSPHIHAI